MKPILQVEDDPNDVFLLQHAMKKVGLAQPVQVAQDGQEAIDYMQGAGKFSDRKQFPLPCLVLLDLKLPYIMGLEVLKRIRQQFGMVLPVIILSASREDEDITTAYRLGANAFLTKPSEASKLEEMVRAIKDFWLIQNTLPDSSSEAPMEGVVTLGHVSPMVSPTKPWPSFNGRRRHETNSRALSVAHMSGEAA